MNDKYTYSIIIPHKNTPDLLNRCVDSIPIRDDVQVIVVDDNSDKDKKPIIKRKDVEIILLNAEQSKGAGRARNIGLGHAKGKWLLFADADDYYTEHLNELLDKYAQEDTIDIVYLNACVFNEDGFVGPCEIERLIQNYQNGKYYSEMHLRYREWTPWTRMVSHRLVDKNQLRFDEIPVGNDVCFGIQCSFYAKKIDVDRNYIYQYYKPYKSISQTNKKRDELVLDIMVELRVRKGDLYRKAGYKYIPSFGSLFYKSKYTQNIQRNKRIKLYLKVLKNNNKSLFLDLFYFFRNKFYELSAKI